MTHFREKPPNLQALPGACNEDKWLSRAVSLIEIESGVIIRGSSLKARGSIGRQWQVAPATRAGTVGAKMVQGRTEGWMDEVRLRRRARERSGGGSAYQALPAVAVAAAAAAPRGGEYI